MPTDPDAAPGGLADVDEGGDPACWLDRVCPACGAVVEDGAAHRCPPGTPPAP